MQAPKKPKAGPQRKTRKRILKSGLALAVVLIVLAFFLVPAFVSSEKGRKIILTRINNSIDGRINFAGLSMGWLKGVKVTDFNFQDSAGQTLVRMGQIETKPHYAAILFGTLSFGKTTIDEPAIVINLKPKQIHKTKVSPQKPAGNKESQLPMIPIKKIDLTVNNGNLKVTDSKGKTVELSQIITKVNLRPPPGQTNFDIEMAVVDEGKESKIHADGRISPGKAKTGWTLKGTSGNFSVQVTDLNLPSLAPFFALAGVDIKAEGLLSANVTGEIKDGQIDNLSANLKGGDLDVTGSELKGDRFKTGTLDVDVTLKKSKKLINIQKLQIQTDWLTARASGDVPTTFESLVDFVKADSIYNLNGSFDCDLAAASSLMPHTFELKEGTKITSGRLNGNIETLTKAGKRKIYGRGSLIGLAGEVEGKTIAISEPVSATAEITSDKTGGLVVSANSVDLEKLQPFAVLFASFPREMQLAGTAESDISISAENQHYRIITDSTKIKNLKFSYPGQKAFEQEEVLLIFEAEVNPEQKAINVKKMQLTSPQIKIHKGEFSHVSKAGKTRLEGQVDCEYDWSAVNIIAGPFLPEGLKLQGKRKDAINFAGEYPTGRTDKLLANLNTKAKLGFEKAQYMGLNFGPTEVDIQIQNGLLKIAPFSTTVNNGQFNFAAEADFKKKPTLLRTPGPIEIAKDIQINDETTRRLLMYLNPIFANTVNVSGVANFGCERLAIPLAGAAKNDLEVVGTISLNKLRLQPSNLLGQILSLVGTGLREQEITIRPTKFVLQNGFLKYDDMQMDIGDNPLNFTGVIGLDKSLNMTATLPYTLKGRTVRVDKETVAQRISLPLRGTIDKPVFDLGKLLEEQLRRQLEQELLKGLEGLFK